MQVPRVVLNLIPSLPVDAIPPCRYMHHHVWLAYRYFYDAIISPLAQTYVQNHVTARKAIRMQSQEMFSLDTAPGSILQKNPPYGHMDRSVSWPLRLPHTEIADTRISQTNSYITAFETYIKPTYMEILRTRHFTCGSKKITDTPRYIIVEEVERR